LQQEFKILSTVIENTFVVYSRLNLSSISPIINGLSDNDAHILTIKNIHAIICKYPSKQRTRLIENETITNFQTLLKKETLESAYKDKHPNNMFN